MRATIWIAGAALALTLAPQTALANEDAPKPAAQERQKVLGFGGLFFRADDPAALAEWYKEHLGIDRVPTTYEVEPWQQEAGPTVFSPFPRSATSMAPEDKQFVFNFRVADLDAMVAQLEAAGIAVEVDPETYPNGRFAGLEDPEGNPIQLWQPMVPGETSPER